MFFPEFPQAIDCFHSQVEGVFRTPDSIVNFTDTSGPDVHPIENWNWTFEQGMDSTYSSKIPVISHWFNHPGIFQVTLLVTDTFGCKGGASTIISTSNPIAEFLAGNPQVCLGDEILLYYTPQSIDSLFWDFETGSILRDVLPGTL